MKQLVESCQILLEEAQESQHCLMGILDINPQRKIALPIKEAMLSPVCALWQPPATISPTCNKADKNNYIPSKGMEHIFPHPNLDFLVMEAANERNH